MWKLTPNCSRGHTLLSMKREVNWDQGRQNGVLAMFGSGTEQLNFDFKNVAF